MRLKTPHTGKGIGTTRYNVPRVNQGLPFLPFNGSIGRRVAPMRGKYNPLYWQVTVTVFWNHTDDHVKKQADGDIVQSRSLNFIPTDTRRSKTRISGATNKGAIAETFRPVIGCSAIQLV